MNNPSRLTTPVLDRQYDRLSWGVVELQVINLQRSVDFWKAALGLIERNRTPTGVALGTKAKTLFVLHAGASRAVERSYTGMYHVAIGVRSQIEFSRLLARLIHLEVDISPTDHLMAKSIYLVDPDGLEIEITLETPERFGYFGDMSKGLTMYDVQGRPHSGRDPLNVDAELSYAQDANLMANMADDAYLAHLHFKVGSLEPALDWFEKLGFSRHLTLANWGFADMGAGLENTHRLAMNIWAGPDHPTTPEDMARLIRYELILHDDEVLKSTPLQQDGDDWHGIDPVGVNVSLRYIR